MVKCVQLVGRLRDRATALFGGKIRIVVATMFAIVTFECLIFEVHTFQVWYTRP